MKSSFQTWVCRGLWLTLPLTVGEIVSGFLGGATTASMVTWQIVLWATWAVVLAASLVQVPPTLTVVRIAMPLGPLAALGFWANAEASSVNTALATLGVVLAVGASVLVMSADVGADFIDGASYGDERRLGLRAPGFLLIGPLYLVWLLTVGPLVAAAVLFASGLWLAGLPTAAIGVATCAYGFRVLNRLAQRCIVLVPAGLTLVDPLALAEPTLFRRDDVSRLGPAVVGSEGLDLTVGSPGLAVAVEFNRPVSVVPAVPRGQSAQAVDVGSVLLAPSRPGRLLGLAQDRRIIVDRS